MKVVWSAAARKDLLQIRLFIARNFSLAIAEKWIDRILERADALAFIPEIGKVDSYVKGNDGSFRYIIVNKSRIRYQVLDNELRVLRVHDARQNPLKF